MYVNQSLILAHEIKYGSGEPYVYTLILCKGCFSFNLLQINRLNFKSQKKRLEIFETFLNKVNFIYCFKTL